jgi:hypothetical protein
MPIFHPAYAVREGKWVQYKIEEDLMNLYEVAKRGMSPEFYEGQWCVFCGKRAYNIQKPGKVGPGIAVCNKTDCYPKLRANFKRVARYRKFQNKQAQGELF